MVTRTAGTKVLVRVQSPRDVPHLHEFGSGNGPGAGGGNDAALVDAPPSVVADDRRREQQRIDPLWRAAA